MKKKNNITYFITPETYFSLFPTDIRFEEEVIVLDFIIKDFSQGKKYYLCYFPNINEEEIDIYVQGENILLPEEIEIIKIQKLNPVFGVVKRVVEMDVNDTATPPIFINGQEITPNKKDSYLYLKARSILNEKVFYPQNNKKCKAVRGNEYHITQLNNGFNLSYAIKNCTTYDTVFFENEFDLQFRIKNKKIFLIEKKFFITLVEAYYYLRIYKLKKILEKIKITKRISDRIERDYKIILKDDLEKTLKENEK